MRGGKWRVVRRERSDGEAFTPNAGISDGILDVFDQLHFFIKVIDPSYFYLAVLAIATFNSLKQELLYFRRLLALKCMYEIFTAAASSTFDSSLVRP
jgi:hypothetical protein